MVASSILSNVFPSQHRLFAFLDNAFLVPGLALAGSLLVGAAVIALFRRWQRDAARGTSADASDQLSQYRALYEKGEISEEEFKRLRGVLGGELRKAQAQAQAKAGPGGEGVKPAAAPPSPSPPASEGQPGGPEQPPPQTGITL